MCAEHQRVIATDEVYDDWLRAYEEMRSRLGDVLSSNYDSALQSVAYTAMGKIRRQCAYWRGELEIAEWMAESEARTEELSLRGLSLEEAARGHRLLRRTDRLQEAIGALSEAPGIDESGRWAMLAALYEAKDQAEEELERFRSGQPA